jgi:ribonuclease T1
VRSSSRSRITLALVGLIVLVLAGWFVREQVTDGSAAAPALPVRPLSTLPAEATATWRLIEKGGPFPYRSDGVVYENREKLLPHKESSYYHEYTVRTPGSADRGARRLVTGSGHELYYTGDHYKSFVAVDPNR